MDFATLGRRLRSYESQAFGQGASEPEIDAAESALGVALPDDYKQFLRQFGWGGVEFIELYGIGSDVPNYLNLIELSRSERTEMNPPIPRHLVPIMNDGGGNLHCLDTSRLFDGRCPVIFWDHAAGPHQAYTDIGVDFITWLNEQLP